MCHIQFFILKIIKKTLKVNRTSRVKKEKYGFIAKSLSFD